MVPNNHSGDHKTMPLAIVSPHLRMITGDVPVLIIDPHQWAADKMLRAFAACNLAPVVANGADVLECLAVAPGTKLAILIDRNMELSPRLVLARLRASGIQRIVLFGPSHGSASHIWALEAGFDEVWDGLVSSTHLSALVLALVRGISAYQLTNRKQINAPISFSDLTIDETARACAFRGKWLPMTATLTNMLVLMASRSPAPASRTELLLCTVLNARIDGGDEANPRVVDTQISRLRRMLKQLGALEEIQISHVRFVGYRMHRSSQNGQRA